jgi:hypothetical protein
MPARCRNETQIYMSRMISDQAQTETGPRLTQSERFQGLPRSHQLEYCTGVWSLDGRRTDWVQYSQYYSQPAV